MEKRTTHNVMNQLSNKKAELPMFTNIIPSIIKVEGINTTKLVKIAQLTMV